MNISLTEMVDKIIGRYTSYGSSELDSDALSNLDAVEEIITNLLYKVCWNVCEGNKAYEHSVKKVGERSQRIVDEVKEILNGLDN